MTDTTLEQRLRRLEDIEAIRGLTARHADAINKGWNGKTLALGADAIAAELPEATGMVEFSMHAFLNPIITVDGDTSTGHWLMWIASLIADSPRAIYMSADMTYTRTDQGWRIHTVRVDHGTKLSLDPPMGSRH